MLNIIKRVLAFLLPILGKAALQTAADVITDVAYPERRPRRTSYSQPPRGYTDMVDYAERDVQATAAMYESDDKDADVIHFERPDGYRDVLMIAFDISADDMRTAQDFLYNYMPVTGDQIFNGKRVNLDAWWIADDIAGESDCDSAVFVNRGDQDTARAFLRRGGLSGGTGSV